MSLQPDLGHRLARLEARASISDLMQDYACAADRKYTALREKAAPDVVARAAHDQAACFAPDGIWAGGRFGGDLTGRPAIEAFFTTSPWLMTTHHYGSMSVQFPTGASEGLGARAHLRWRLLEIGIPESDGRVLLLAGAVDQECRLTDEGWRISRMCFTRLHAVALASQSDALRCLIPAGEPI